MFADLAYGRLLIRKSGTVKTTKAAQRCFAKRLQLESANELCASYTRAPLSRRVLVTFTPPLLPRMLMNPRTVWALCRHRHKAHYADVRIMPTCVGNPVCGTGIAAMESA